MGLASRLPPGAEAGVTNLTCPNCEHRLGVVQLLRHFEQNNIPLRDIGSVQISLRVIIGDSAANSRRFERLPIFRNEIASIL